MKKVNWLFIILWCILLLPILLVITITIAKKDGPGVEINQQQFEEFIKQGNIADVVLVRNQNKVEVTLNDEAISKSEYQKELGVQNAFSNANGPHYYFEITNPNEFDRNFEEAQKNMPIKERIGYRVEERSDMSSFVLNWGFLLWILTAIPILALWFIFKLFWSTKPKEKPQVHSVKESANHVSMTSEPAKAENFPIRIGDRTIFLSMEKIVSFQAKENYVYVHDTEDNHYLIEYTLNELEEKLPQQFVRVHRSYIVNKLLIKEIRKHSGNRFTLSLKSKKPQQLVSSQGYAPKVKEIMKF